MVFTKMDEYEAELAGGRKLKMVQCRDTKTGNIRHLTAEEYAAMAGPRPVPNGTKPTPPAMLIRRRPDTYMVQPRKR